MTDDELDDLFAPLRAIEPDIATRRANRRVALRAVQPVPWWQRTIAVPVPIALTAAVTLLLTVGWGIRSADPEPADRSSETRMNVVSPIGANPDPTLIATASHSQEGVVYESASYVPGIGFVDRVSLYPIQE